MSARIASRWADDGKTITWALGSSFFRQPLSTVTFDQPPADRRRRPTLRPKLRASRQPRSRPYGGDHGGYRSAALRRPKAAIVLRGAKIITMKGDEIIPDGEIVVTDNRITSVGKARYDKMPAGAKVIDVKGATIMPGIVDVHAHWTEMRRGVLDLQSWPFLANLAYGVTTGRDPQTAPTTCSLIRI